MRLSSPLLVVNFALVFLVSCGRSYPLIGPPGPVEANKPAHIAVTPTVLRLRPGEVHIVSVKVKDAHKNPLNNVLVQVRVSTVNTVSVEPESVLTNEMGEATFLVQGIAETPTRVGVTFTADSVLNNVEAFIVSE